MAQTYNNSYQTEKNKKKSESMLSLLFPLQRQWCSLEDTTNITAEKENCTRIDDEKVVAYITKAEKRPLGLESDVDSTLAILVNNSTSTTTANDKTCKLMVSLVFQMALTRTSTDPLHKRPLGKVTILTTSAWPSMPKAMHGMPKATFQALSFLNFVFIKDLNDLHKYLLVLPNSAYAPDLLILDDSLEAFVDNQLKLSKVLALLRHLTECMQKK